MANAFLLTWNPQKWDWGSGYSNSVNQSADGISVPDSWSTGSRKSGIAEGDRLFLLRQGTNARGLIGSATATSAIDQGPHWAGDGREANYIDLEWDTLLEIDQRIPIDDLKRDIPNQDWEPQASGTILAPEVFRELAHYWSDHVGREIPDMPRSGFLRDSALRREIEDEAQDRLMKYYRKRKYKVYDTRYGNPFDAVAERGDETIYLEAKGTTGPGEQVLLTAGEVQHSRKLRGACVIGILSNVKIADRHVVRGSGDLVVMPFDPEGDDLTATQYRWRVPGGEQLI